MCFLAYMKKSYVRLFIFYMCAGYYPKLATGIKIPSISLTFTKVNVGSLCTKFMINTSAMSYRMIKVISPLSIITGQ